MRRQDVARVFFRHSVLLTIAEERAQGFVLQGRGPGKWVWGDGGMERLNVVW